jgi:hypothetical protein
MQISVHCMAVDVDNLWSLTELYNKSYLIKENYLKLKKKSILKNIILTHVSFIENYARLLLDC